MRVGDGNSITSPRTSSNQRLAFSGRWVQSWNSSAVIRVAVAVGFMGDGPPFLSAQLLAGQGDGAVDDDLLAQRGGDDVRQPRERPEDAAPDCVVDRAGPLDPLADGGEEQLLPHQGDAAADDDTPGAKQGDDVAARLGEGRPGVLQDVVGE